VLDDPPEGLSELRGLLLIGALQPPVSAPMWAPRGPEKHFDVGEPAEKSRRLPVVAD
jgi:hypothetical protein